MSHNPYQPPRSTVGDPEIPSMGERPAGVDLAVKLLWMSFAIGVLVMIVQWKVVTAEASPAVTIFGMSFGFLVALFFIHFIGKGRNWARVVFLVLALLGLPIFLMQLPNTFKVSPLAGIIGIVQTGIQYYALYLLFLTPARLWFGRRS